MGRNKGKTLATSRVETKTYTDSLTKQIEDTKNSTKILSKLWENKMSDYKSNALHHELLSYQKFLTRQMAFKDKLIENLKNELNELMECRHRTSLNNLELVDKILNTFKRNIDEIHDQYQVEVKRALPENLDELKFRINENDNWKILKYYNNAVKFQTKMKNTKIKNKHIENMNIEARKLEPIIHDFRWMNMTQYKPMWETYSSILDDFKKNNEHLKKEYFKLKEKDEALLILQKKSSARIKKLTNEINDLEKILEEPKILVEMNKLIEKKNELKDELKNGRKVLANITEYGSKQLLRLGMTTKKVYNEMEIMTQKGSNLMRYIRLCQKLEISENITEKKTNWFLKCNAAGIQLSGQNSPLEKLSNLFCCLSNVKASSSLINREIEKLQHENNELKEKIRRQEVIRKTRKKTF